jgi:hypothetical protein
MTEPDLTKRYSVVDVHSNEYFGNHTYWEAVSRARHMNRVWRGQKKFDVQELR